MAAFVANVGVNAAHRVESPLFEDGTFVLYPIPEHQVWAHPMRQLPDVWGDRAVHLDPDLDGDPPTYGDNCRTAGRAFSLRRAEPGDVIVFLARLRPRSGEHPAFYLVGSPAVGAWNSFWVFRGDGRSRFYDRAVPFRRVEADHVFGRAWTWREGRTELQTIGSYTRAVRRLTGTAERRLGELVRP
ncbi:MAG: hypothetical protein E6J41_13950 [Chloroflexi bacterium]|nr:MAG: hypothetical protein E6J41_13950 [Chloroflexota bacterium]